VVEVVVPALPVPDTPLWDLSRSLLPVSVLVEPVFAGCDLSRILPEVGFPALSFALKSMPPTLTWVVGPLEDAEGKAARSPTARAEANSKFLTGVCLIDGKTSPEREEHVACHGTDACHVN
jgi:hypothetical protein